jgi:guanine deaminase
VIEAQAEIDAILLSEAIGLAQSNVVARGRPFGAVVARNDDVLVRAVNLAATSGDPTDHAEVVAIRAATALPHLETLTGLTLYASCEPCCMCASAIRWAGIRRVVFGLQRETAEGYGFRDVVSPDMSRAILNTVDVMHLPSLEELARVPFDAWRSSRADLD